MKTEKTINAFLKKFSLPQRMTGFSFVFKNRFADANFSAGFVLNFVLNYEFFPHYSR